MPAPTVKLNERSRQILRKLAAESGESMQATLERAIELYRRHRFLEQANAAYAALREDAEAWQTELRERADWEATLADGLER